ncbi:MAG TPA: large conductance mechanosensitive channel protein MscL [Gaiellaceae bacterium]|nr:large conductance mechanosensitive channel protein MscL [Gaiellaceae bacterium]
MTAALKEFRDFLLRGNLVTLAVAFVMGAAFAALVAAFVNDLVMPLIAAIFGKVDFSGLTFTIHHAVFSWGAFVTAVITFVSIAAAVFFFVVKPVDVVQKRRAQGEEAAPPSDEERRHQELIAAINAVGTRT